MPLVKDRATSGPALVCNFFTGQQGKWFPPPCTALESHQGWVAFNPLTPMRARMLSTSSSACPSSPLGMNTHPLALSACTPCFTYRQVTH